MDSKLWKLKKESPRYKWAVVAAGVEELNSTRRIGKWVKSAENWWKMRNLFEEQKIIDPKNSGFRRRIEDSSLFYFCKPL